MLNVVSKILSTNQTSEHLRYIMNNCRKTIAETFAESAYALPDQLKLFKTGFKFITIPEDLIRNQS